MSNISQRLDLRHSQNLVMTPQLQQAIKLLQLSNAELAEYIEGELAQNPLLEKADAEGGKAEDTADAPATSEEGDEVQADFDNAWTGNEAQAPQESAPLPDFDPGTTMAPMSAPSNTSFDAPDQTLENTVQKQKTLRDHLSEQLHLAFEDPRDHMIGAQLIDMLDESGYLRQDPDDLIERLACPKLRLMNILSKMRQFDPTGIFAHDLKDCLTLQLEEQDKLDEPMKKLLENLDLVAVRDYSTLASRCKVNETYLQDMIADIRALNPKPASNFEHLVVQTAVPDVLMRRLPKGLGGGWRVELNSETLPRVLVNETYYTEVAGRTKGKKDKEYLSQQLQNAHWLVKAMDQRAKTILKVAGEIVEAQDGFFLYGIEFLKPLTLKDIAEKIGMHESTVSRVTSNKYIGTPRGIFELKYFFSTALGEGASAISAEAVKARIKTLIDAEDPKKILSDDSIAETLTKEGVEIARRTVAKYREELRIPSSVQRRRLKKK
ncbi:MAG TPA: RNA polymerase factor sigma-54 [Patescibacteria group bacterium]|nr:RNA polymerase factor sigma-54 [Patescibacteria group bacterium]